MCIIEWCIVLKSVTKNPIQGSMGKQDDAHKLHDIIRKINTYQAKSNWLKAKIPNLNMANSSNFKVDFISFYELIQYRFAWCRIIYKGSNL